MIAALIYKMTVFKTLDRINLILIVPELKKILQYYNNPILYKEVYKTVSKSNGGILEIVGT